jgi:membrane-bound inhibitor of C-type lysozyme
LGWRRVARRDRQLLRHPIITEVASAMKIWPPSFVMVAALCATPAAAKPVEMKRETVAEFACQSSSILRVRLTSRLAQVSIDGRQYSLQRRPSSLGARYSSRQGTLIVDGSFATFVAAGTRSGSRCWTADDLAVYVPD